VAKNPESLPLLEHALDRLFRAQAERKDGEQDRRTSKRRVNASQHFRSFWGAWRTKSRL
jgi:hypothetical protein